MPRRDSRVPPVYRFAAGRSEEITMRPSTAAAAVVIALALPIGTVTAAPRADDTIDLPAGFAGEGVAVGEGNTFYAGSRAGGHIARGNLRQRTAEVWVTQPILNAAIGLDADVRHGLLWAAGGMTGAAAAYDLETAAPAAPALMLTAGPAFINDVVSTRDAAYFTNSLAPELYRVPVSRRGGVGTPETIDAHRARRRVRPRVQPQRDRRHPGRQDAHRRQQHQGRALHGRRRVWRERPHRSRGRDRSQPATGSCSTGARCTSSRTATRRACPTRSS